MTDTKSETPEAQAAELGSFAVQRDFERDELRLQLTLAQSQLAEARRALEGVNVELCSLISPPFDEATAESFPSAPNIADRDATRAALALTRTALSALQAAGISVE